MESIDKITELTSTLDNFNTLSDTEESDKEIIDLSKEATSYLLSYEWCSEVVDGWLAISWGYILGVFLYKIKSKYPEVDEYVWMVVGDIPPAYIDIESANNPEEALRSYVGIMGDWVAAVESNKSVEECYPIEVPATIENALMLKSRLNLILEELSSEE